MLHFSYEIWNFRSHIRIVFKERFRGAYQGAGLGLFWNYLLPLIPLTVYWFLSIIRVFPSFDGVDGATFITFGVTLWFLFVGCIQTPIQIVASRNNEAMKTAFPLSASIVTGFAQLAFDTGIRLSFVIVIILIGQSLPSWSAFLLPIVLLPGILLFLGIGIILSILNAIYKDVSRIVNIALQYGIFISGVIFPVNQFEILRIINSYNPFAIFIEQCRAIAFEPGMFDFISYAAVSFLAVGIFLMASKAFYIVELRLRGIG